MTPFIKRTPTKADRSHARKASAWGARRAIGLWCKRPKPSRGIAIAGPYGVRLPSLTRIIRLLREIVSVEHFGCGDLGYGPQNVLVHIACALALRTPRLFFGVCSFAAFVHRCNARPLPCGK